MSAKAEIRSHANDNGRFLGPTTFVVFRSDIFAGNIASMIDLIILAVLFVVAAIGLVVHLAGKLQQGKDQRRLR